MTTSSSDSMNFDINNQQGLPDNEREESPIESQMTEETSDIRARGQESQQPQEEVTLRALMDFMSKKFEETRREQKEEISENLRVINENFTEIRREQAENNKVLSEKLDKHKEEVTQQMTELFTMLRTDIREHMNTWNDNRNEVQKKQEEDVNKNYEDVRKVQGTDNAVDFTDVSATKKLSDVYKRQMCAQRENILLVTSIYDGRPEWHLGNDDTHGAAN